MSAFSKFLNKIIVVNHLMSYNKHLSEDEFENFFEKGLEDLKKAASDKNQYVKTK